ncbi:hypothetical protein GN156_00250 [bacterium LRH843]|nr:hypothetical protein [bacterium LRH843]
MTNYSEDDIRRAVDEVVAAGMEKFLYQEPVPPEKKEQTRNENSDQINK